MKAHFIGAVDGNKDDYRMIINYIRDEGWDVITEHSIERNISDIQKETSQEAEEYSRKMTSWIKEADVVVVETTKAVLGAGFELATSLSLGKPTIALYRPVVGDQPHVLKGLDSEKLQVISYSSETLQDSLRQALKFAIETQDTRFNFFISPKHQHYLDWIAKNKRIPRSVFLRRMIEQHIAEDEEYKG